MLRRRWSAFRHPALVTCRVRRKVCGAATDCTFPVRLSSTFAFALFVLSFPSQLALPSAASRLFNICCWAAMVASCAIIVSGVAGGWLPPLGVRLPPRGPLPIWRRCFSCCASRAQQFVPNSVGTSEAVHTSIRQADRPPKGARTARRGPTRPQGAHRSTRRAGREGERMRRSAQGAYGGPQTARCHREVA